jgi:hypothetical protein
MWLMLTRCQLQEPGERFSRWFGVALKTFATEVAVALQVVQ